ncbi:hypothetical protein [Falsiroseomonas sp.]|uniref:hypothetical protein n=1 Tax=Falsiroseomonas sp. TaxID=2870721 RepID=UPI003F70E216
MGTPDAGRGLAKDSTEAVAPAARSPEFSSLERLPMALAELPRVSLVEDQTPGIMGGAIAAYRGPAFSITVFLFRRSAEPVPPGPDSLPILSELISSSAAARQAATRVFGPTQESRLVRMQIRGGVVLCQQHTYRAGPNEVHDFHCVTSQDGRLLKLWMTFSLQPGEHERAQRGVAATLALIQGHLSGPPAATTRT